jgi:hypothetical protein
VTFDEAWPNRVIARVAPELEVPFRGRGDLIKNKRAVGRPKPHRYHLENIRCNPWHARCVSPARPVRRPDTRADPTRRTIAVDVGLSASAGGHMDRVGQLTFEMVTRTVKFNGAQPDTDPGPGIISDRLQQVQGGMADAIAAQRAGRIKRHGGSLEKRRLKRETLAGPIPYLVELGELAGRDHPELVAALRYAPAGHSYLAHRTAARGLQAAAIAHKDVLSQYGLSDALMEVFDQQLRQFDAAIQDADDGRSAQKSATAVLDKLVAEALRLVRLLNARNQQRFKGNPELLSAWLDASTVLGLPQSQDPEDDAEPSPERAGPQAQGESPTAGGDVRPAA